MKILCKIKVHNWEIVESFKTDVNKVLVTQYKMCTDCGKVQPIGAYQYFKKAKLGAIINQLNLN